MPVYYSSAKNVLNFMAIMGCFMTYDCMVMMGCDVIVNLEMLGFEV